MVLSAGLTATEMHRENGQSSTPSANPPAQVSDVMPYTPTPQTTGKRTKKDAGGRRRKKPLNRSPDGTEIGVKTVVLARWILVRAAG